MLPNRTLLSSKNKHQREVKREKQCKPRSGINTPSRIDASLAWSFLSGEGRPIRVIRRWCEGGHFMGFDPFTVIGRGWEVSRCVLFCWWRGGWESGMFSLMGGLALACLGSIVSKVCLGRAGDCLMRDSVRGTREESNKFSKLHYWASEFMR